MIDIDLLVVHERRTNQRLTDQTITISYDDMTLSNAIADVTYSVSNTLGESCKPYVFRVLNIACIREELKLTFARGSAFTMHVKTSLSPGPAYTALCADETSGGSETYKRGSLLAEDNYQFD